MELYYQLRGPRLVSSKIEVVTLPASTSAIRQLPETFQNSLGRCIDVSEEPLLLGPCKRIDLTNKFSVSSIVDLQIELTEALKVRPLKNLSTEELLYSGTQSVFKELNYRDLLSKSKGIDSDKILVLLSYDYQTGPLLTTPFGPMHQSDVFLNFLANLVEGRHLVKGTIWQQIALCAATIVITSYFVYSLPTAITLIYLAGLFVFLILASFISFETLDLQILIAAPFLSAIVTYLLGVSDRLDRRDRSEWSIEREKESLRRLDEMRNNFLSLISHDLKTPIAKIQSIVERLMNAPANSPDSLKSDDRNVELQKILSANNEMHKNISSLLLLSRIEAQQFQLKREPTALNELLESVADGLEELLLQKKIKLVKELEPQFLVAMDQTLIREVASNLIGNAIKYSPDGAEITLRCGDQENDQSLVPPQPSVWFEVRDSGPGIPHTEQGRVFEKFFRGSNENAPVDQPIQGSGLGLYLSAFFVERHQGQIMLFSQTAKDPTPDPDSDPENSSEYFKSGETGTVMRVALPQESLYD